MESKGIPAKQSKNIKIDHQTQHLVTAKNPNLPEEIIIEILLRLPVKILVKFRCVSRSWLSIISSPRFIKTHFEISSKDSTLTNHRVMFTVYNLLYNLKQCSASSLMLDDVINIVDYAEIRHYRSVWVVGSCNGLLCISVDERNLFFWNPAMRMYAKLPGVDVDITVGFMATYGFGYSEVTDEYKLLGIFCSYRGGEVHDLVVKMYSSGTDSWKEVEGWSGGSEGGLPMQNSGVFASGKLHFPLIAGNGTRWVVAFDVDTERFCMLEQPDYGEGRLKCTLGVFGGRVCVLCNHGDGCTDVWVLKEMRDSWTKVAAFPYANEAWPFEAARPLLELATGEVLLVCEKAHLAIYNPDDMVCEKARLAIYNPEDNSLRHPEPDNLGNFVQAEVYVESLVSPPGVLKTMQQKKVRQVN